MIGETILAGTSARCKQAYNWRDNISLIIGLQSESWWSVNIYCANCWPTIGAPTIVSPILAWLSAVSFNLGKPYLGYILRFPYRSQCSNSVHKKSWYLQEESSSSFHPAEVSILKIRRIFYPSYVAWSVVLLILHPPFPALVSSASGGVSFGSKGPPCNILVQTIVLLCIFFLLLSTLEPSTVRGILRVGLISLSSPASFAFLSFTTLFIVSVFLIHSASIGVVALAPATMEVIPSEACTKPNFLSLSLSLSLSCSL